MLNEGEICVFLRPKNSLDNTTFLISMKKLLLTALLTATCVVADAASEPNKPSSENPTVRLPRFISSGMVLQRGDTARVWGWADANTAIKVQFAGKKFNAVADADGRWSVAIPTTAKKLTGGPYKMTINELTLDDIWVGDVWLCSGQSNMDLHIARLEDLYKDETDRDSNPAIHLVQMGRTPQVVDPQDDVVPMGFYKWESMKPENVGHWSGIGYFYAKEMYRRTGVPQGIISASMGGSDIVAWCSEEVLSANAPRHLAQRNHLRTPGYLERNAGISRAISRAYNEAYEADDPGLNEKWMSADFDDSSWETVSQYDMNIGDEIEVFLYLDQSERLVATTEHPIAKVGEFAWLECAWTNEYGAFLRWGLQKDLFCPFREQKQRMERGKAYIIYIKEDEETHRLMATAKVEKYLTIPYAEAPSEQANAHSNTEPQLLLKHGQQCDCLVWQKTDLGFKVIVDNSYQGQLYDNQLFRPLHTGDRLTAYVDHVRQDGKVDLTLQPTGHRQTLDFAEVLLRYLHENGGRCSLGDHSPAELIADRFQVSKKTFKRAVGDLYRRRLITISDNGLQLA